MTKANIGHQKTITTIEEQKRPVKPIIHLFMLVAWDRQGDWTNRELTYVCFWKRKAQNISFLFLLSLLFQYISFDWPNCLQLLPNSCYPFSRLLPFAQSTYKVNKTVAFIRFTMFFSILKPKVWFIKNWNQIVCVFVPFLGFLSKLLFDIKNFSCLKF